LIFHFVLSFHKSRVWRTYYAAGQLRDSCSLFGFFREVILPTAIGLRRVTG
jgi:hypothetical protein